MKNFLKKLLRTHSLAAKLLIVLAKLSPSPKVSRQLAMLYFQSEAARPDLADNLDWVLANTRVSHSAENITLSKSAIIKAYGPEERGALLVGFEHELDRLIGSKHFPYLVEKYDIFFMPTWQPFYSEALLKMLKAAPQSLFLLPSSEGCYYKALSLPQYFQALPFHASSWVNAALYTPKEKDIDILMVANFANYKRHILLFEALQKLPKTLKVVLVGRPLADRKAADLIAEATRYGVQDRFELIEAPTNQFVSDCLCRAKLVLGLSGREGSYVSLAEALFADAAVAVYKDAHIGTKNYINPRTGFLIQPDMPLADQIIGFLARIQTLAPRSWAVNNIDAKLNVERLNRIMRSLSEPNSEKWRENCESFYIQSFEIFPESGSWSTYISAQVRQLDELGIKLRTQLATLK